MEFRSVIIGFLSVVSVFVGGVEGSPPPGENCYSGSSVFAAVVGTLVITIGLLSAAYVLRKIYWNSKKGKHLILVTDTEKGGDFAFDNPGFREGTPINHISQEKEELKIKWPQFTSPINILGGSGNTKPRALDDSFVKEPFINVVPLRSHDFTGLGFNICGNMRDGIFVKDVLHRGPASESGKIVSGDRITSVRISFKHMVFEDALTILSYASPYEVQLEVENGSSSGPSTLLRNKKTISPAERICHPFYRSQSISDLTQIGKSRTRLITCEQPVSLTDMTTVGVSRQSVFEITPNRNSEKAQKFGVRVLPEMKLSPDTSKTFNYVESEKQNACNTMLEYSTSQSKANPNFVGSKTESFDEVDLGSSKHTGGGSNSHSIDRSTGRNTPTSHFKENNVKSILVKGLQNLKEKINLQHIHKQSNGKVMSGGVSEDSKDLKPTDHVIENFNAEGRIRLEPVAMKNDELQEIVITGGDESKNKRVNSQPAVEGEKGTTPLLATAKQAETPEKPVTRTRKDSGCSNGSSTEEGSAVKKGKRKPKAPLPPQELKSSDMEVKVVNELENAKLEPETGFVAEVMSLVDCSSKFINDSEHVSLVESIDSDSEMQSSATIELNSSHITVHHVPEDNRKAASLGDLSKIADDEPSVVLERAMSLDMADGTPRGSKKRKAPLPPQEDFILDDMPFCKEPRLDLVGLTKLKKSSVFGTLEEALSQSQDFDRSFSDSDSSNEGCKRDDFDEKPIANNRPDLLCSTPTKTELDKLTTVPNLPNSAEMNVSSVKVDNFSWDLGSSAAEDTYLSALNSSEQEDRPPDLPTSPVPTIPSYVTEIQVTNANESDITSDELTMMLNDADSTQNNVIQRNHEETLHNTSQSSEEPQSDSMEANHMFKATPMVNDTPSPVDSNSSVDTIYTPPRGHKSNSSNELSMFLKDNQKPQLDSNSYQFNFKNENMSDEEILALKTSALSSNITSALSPPSSKPKLSNGETTPNNGTLKQSKITPPSKIQKPNVSITPIKASGSRIPVRSTPEPSARFGTDKNRKRSPEPNKLVSFSTFNITPSPRSLSMDHKFTDRNSSSNENITQIILDAQK